jgi:hypothetical protein
MDAAAVPWPANENLILSSGLVHLLGGVGYAVRP